MMKNITVLLMLAVGITSAKSDFLYFQFWGYHEHDKVLYKSNHFTVDICNYVDCSENFGIDRYNRFSVKIQEIFDDEVSRTRACTYGDGGVDWAHSNVDLDHKVTEKIKRTLSANRVRWIEIKKDSLYLKREVGAKFREWKKEIEETEKNRRLEKEKKQLAEIRSKKAQRRKEELSRKTRGANRAYQMKAQQNRYIYNNCMAGCSNYNYHQCMKKCEREHKRRDAQALEESYPSSSTKKYSEPEWDWTVFFAVLFIAGATVGLSTLSGAGF